VVGRNEQFDQRISQRALAYDRCARTFLSAITIAATISYWL
jgi:hypothetical protein